MGLCAPPSLPVLTLQKLGVVPPNVEYRLIRRCMHQSSILWVSNKDWVLTPPNQHWKHWYEYQSNPTINSEVQGLVLGNETIILKLGFTLHIHTEGRWPLIWSLHLHIDCRIQLILISMNPMQIWWCGDWVSVFTKKIQSSHHQICTRIIDMGINQILYCTSPVTGPPITTGPAHLVHSWWINQPC